VTRLQGETALITGGGTGLGRAIALAFAREGAKVAVAGRRLDKLQGIVSEIERQGLQALAIPCDVTSGQDAARAVAETAARFGRLNILVNNAGALHVSTIETIPEQE
jgi:NAD(P)-dependent dehydrogenase (short-subunit alcohol dehydrogenase family)